MEKCCRLTGFVMNFGGNDETHNKSCQTAAFLHSIKYLVFAVEFGVI